jgi:hypothetical protein
VEQAPSPAKEQPGAAVPHFSANCKPPAGGRMENLVEISGEI